MCAMAILSALYERDTASKIGKVLDCSMVEGAAYISSWIWSSRDIPQVWEGGKRGTNLLDGGYAAYDTYETKDGKFMAMGSLEPQFLSQALQGFVFVSMNTT
jgi:alpha-methylacyl-CoA racemase